MVQDETRTRRAAALRAELERRILVFDGAMGTAIQARDLSADDFGGPATEGCNEILNDTRPDVILDIHRLYLEAGADILETNTFGSTPLVLGEYGLAERSRELSRKAAELARRAIDAYGGSGPRWVAGSMGPTTRAISVTGGVTFDEMVGHYREQARGLLEGGVDLLLLETCQDTLNVKAGSLAVAQAMEDVGFRVPLMISGTIEAMGTMLAGQGVEALYTSLEHLDLFAVGVNCSTGPSFMTDHVRTLSGLARCHVSCIPNAGLPDENGRYNETPEMLATVLGRFAEKGWLNMTGGCCGTTPESIRAIANAVAGKPPRRPAERRFSRVSGIDFLSLEEENRPIIVGERTNVIGSKKFKELVQEERYEDASEVGRRQVRGGAHILDVCLADPDRNELADMTRFLSQLTRKVKVPLMIDSTDAAVIEEALKLCQGKSIINSVNLEDGEERFERVVPLARRYGAALVVGCIDEDPVEGMAVTRARKLDVARRSHALLTGKYGVPEEDLIFDPLVFPCATGDAKYVGSAVETIEGVRLLDAAFPRSKTILGVSNVSFGLPGAGREVLNSVFLHHAIEAGLDLAIVNSEKLERYASIPEEERRLAEDLLYNRGADPVAAFAAHFRGRVRTPTVRDTSKPLAERLAGYIVEGSRDGLFQDLDEALGAMPPLDIINGPLMKGMDEVGRLFNRNELIVAEVLQSAEAMKAAVGHLTPHMERADSATRGTVLLATVKGDVHDIGKNLVEIILSNNGYRVVNLGIKVLPQDLISAARAHSPDFIGLSGLLVKSAQQMVTTAQDFRESGLTTPVLVGGAALTRKFTETRIAPEYEGPVIYCQDAMDGLDVCNRFLDPVRREELLLGRARRGEPGPAPAPEPRPTAAAPVWPEVEIPVPPDLKLHVVDTLSLLEVFPYVNPQMLYAKHLGLRGSVERLRERGDAKMARLEKEIESLKDEILSRGLMRPRALFRFFAAQTVGDSVILAEAPRGPEVARFEFPRQAERERLCLADWIAPGALGRADYLATFVTSCGEGVRDQAEAWKNAGEYVRSYALQALAIEAAEGLAELLHQRIRAMWGFADPPGMAQKDLFQARYRGIRVSFGYPACPNLEDQATLWRLLEPDRHLGVVLTDGFMMDPEASVSALVFHHPQARYFSVKEAAVGV